jgi:hypothetical protein
VISLRGISTLLWLFAGGGVAGSRALRDSASLDLIAQIDSVVRSEASCWHPASRSAIVAFTNGSGGLNVAQRIATAATGLDHAAFWWL